MTGKPTPHKPEPRADWNLAPPEHVPEPSWAPAALSLGVTMLCWGLISSRIVLAVGTVLFACALAVWIKEIRHERNHS